MCVHPCIHAHEPQSTSRDKRTVCGSLSSFFFFFFLHVCFIFFIFLLDIFFIYISNTILKVPYTLPLPCSHFLALVFPCIGAYKICKTKGPLFPLMAH
jgi:hypothetical protein